MLTTEEARAYVHGDAPHPAYARTEALAATAPQRADLDCRAVFGQIVRPPGR